MSRSNLLSNDWHRVADLAPRFRPQVETALHLYLGEPYYVLLDHATGQSFRVSVGVHEVIQGFDGEQTIDALWQNMALNNHPDLPPQDEMIELVSRLFESNLLTIDRARPKSQRLAQLQREKAQQFWMQLLKSPISPKVPLLNPSAFLAHTAWVSRLLFSPWGYVCMVAWLLWAGYTAHVHWDPLTRNLSDRVLASDNLVILVLVYPVVKTLHELAHGWAIQRFGGQVNEMGVMFLLFIPVPYVDASWANSFRHHHQRALVSMAGILAELGMGAAAIQLWTWMEPGLLRAICFNTIIICTVSTVFFNGNPLLRFDAYYALADALQMPNMATRGNQWVARVWKRLLGLPEAPETDGAKRGARWAMGGYAAVSFIYRLGVTYGIALILMQKLPVVGQLLAIWAFFMSMIWPMLNGMKRLNQEAQQARRRPTVSWRLALITLAAVSLIAWIPMPSTTVFSAIVTNRDQAAVVNESEGTLIATAVEEGQRVQAGQALAQLDPKRLRTEASSNAARLDASAVKVRMQVSGHEAGLAGVIHTELQALEAAQSQLESQIAKADIHAHQPGQWVWASPRPLPGEMVRRGQLLGLIDQADQRQLVGAIPDAARRKINRGITQARWRTVAAVHEEHDATAVEVFANATRALPDDRLSEQAGGDVLTTPAQAGQPAQAVSPVMWFQAHADLSQVRLGEKVWVKLHHPPEPLIYPIYDFLQRELLQKLGPQ